MGYLKSVMDDLGNVAYGAIFVPERGLTKKIRGFALGVLVTSVAFGICQMYSKKEEPNLESKTKKMLLNNNVANYNNFKENIDSLAIE